MKSQGLFQQFSLALSLHSFGDGQREKKREFLMEKIPSSEILLFGLTELVIDAYAELEASWGSCDGRISEIKCIISEENILEVVPVGYIVDLAKELEAEPTDLDELRSSHVEIELVKSPPGIAVFVD